MDNKLTQVYYKEPVYKQPVLKIFWNYWTENSNFQTVRDWRAFVKKLCFSNRNQVCHAYVRNLWGTEYWKRSIFMRNWVLVSGAKFLIHSAGPFLNINGLYDKNSFFEKEGKANHIWIYKIITLWITPVIRPLVLHLLSVSKLQSI